MAYEKAEWHPVTGLGKLVASGEIKNIDQVLESGRPIKEPEIVDMFLPDLEDEVLDIAMMQRMTDSGRRVQFRAVVIVGNRNGYIGFGQGKDVQVGDAIKKAIVKAKMNLVKVQRGCGSWECGCALTHSIPMQVQGTAGSVRVTPQTSTTGYWPRYRGYQQESAGTRRYQRCLDICPGQTRTTINFAKATFNALKETNMIRTGRTL